MGAIKQAGDINSSLGGGTDIGTTIGNLGSALFGDSQTTSGSSSVTSKTSGERRSKLVLEQAAIMKLIEDVLGGDEGIAGIFSQEKGTGLYNTSAAKKESGNLIASLVGELAKLTGEQVTTEEASGTKDTTSQETTESEGLFDKIGLGGLF